MQTWHHVLRKSHSASMKSNTCEDEARFTVQVGLDAGRDVRTKFDVQGVAIGGQSFRWHRPSKAPHGSACCLNLRLSPNLPCKYRCTLVGEMSGKELARCRTLRLGPSPVPP